MCPSPTQTEQLRADRGGERLDVFLSRTVSGLSRTRAKSLIAAGSVTVDDQPARASTRLSLGQSVQFTSTGPLLPAISAQPIELDVVFEDEDLVVVNKPAGMAVHPGPGHADWTLANAVLARYPEVDGVGDSDRPGIVHRLDKDTSGLIVVARNSSAHACLSRQFKSREVEKGYLALVQGSPDPAEAVIDAPIGRHPRDRKRMAIVDGGRNSVTWYRIKERLGPYSLVDVRPKTGRTHQIRVHLASIGHGVVGDIAYGRAHEELTRQFLHAYRLAFRPPSGHGLLEFELDLPQDLQSLLDVLRSSQVSGA